MKKLLLVVLLPLLTFTLLAQQKPAYIIYNAKGKKVSYKKMLKTVLQKDIVLFGETHNNAIAHWLQLELTKDCGAQRQLVLGAEMFEQDNQAALDAYLQGKINAKQLDSQARLWKNYPTDYAPLVNYAKEKKFPFAATNIPRRYASMVAKGGFAVLDTIPAQAKAWMAPLPMAYDSTLPGYVNMVKTMGDHGGPNIPKAQASKDATMAHFILKYYNPGSLFIHYNGSYHSENYEGIGWYLRQQKPDLKYGTITIVSQADMKSLLTENKGKADFIICVDEDMTNTY